MLICGCGSSTQPPLLRFRRRRPARNPKRRSATPKPGAFSREQLIADTRQLADILESAHPDPYINGGGRIAFHRRLHRVLNAIPEEGMTRDEFYRLLRPFVAGVGDAHTNFLGGYEVDRRRPGGVPLRFAVVEESLVVSGVAGEAQRDLLGSRLVSVAGVPLSELVDRQKQLRGIDNQYHGLQALAEQSLWYKPYMQDLIPEWKDTSRVRVELKRPGGSMAAIELAQPETQPSWIAPKSRITLPVPGDSGFLYAFLNAPDSGKEIAYIRFTHMTGYRETREGREPFLTKLKRPPAATDTFRSMVIEMKKRGTETLVLDTRGNHGGDSLIVDILIYFLYGKETLLKMQGFGTGESGVFRYSRLYFADRPSQSLEAINADRMVPLVEGTTSSAGPTWTVRPSPGAANRRRNRPDFGICAHLPPFVLNSNRASTAATIILRRCLCYATRGRSVQDSVWPSASIVSVRSWWGLLPRRRRTRSAPPPSGS